MCLSSLYLLNIPTQNAFHTILCQNYFLQLKFSSNSTFFTDNWSLGISVVWLHHWRIFFFKFQKFWYHPTLESILNEFSCGTWDSLVGCVCCQDVSRPFYSHLFQDCGLMSLWLPQCSSALGFIFNDALRETGLGCWFKLARAAGDRGHPKVTRAERPVYCDHLLLELNVPRKERSIFFKSVGRLDSSVHFIALKSSRVPFLREDGKGKQ